MYFYTYIYTYIYVERERGREGERERERERERDLFLKVVAALNTFGARYVLGILRLLRCRLLLLRLTLFPRLSL